MPTRNYSIFTLAQTLHMTVRELLTGDSGSHGGMTALEYYLWGRYELATERLRQQEKRTRKPGGKQ